MADLLSTLDEISEMVEKARPVPLSASCVVHRAEVLAALDRVRELLPVELAQADTVLRERAEVVDAGRREAERLVAAAHEERARLAAETEVLRAAREEAERVRLAAEDAARETRREIEDYVDRRLANFEVVLNKTLAAVARGRDKLHGRQDAEELVDLDRAEDLQELTGLTG